MGKIFGAWALGIYKLASTIANLPATEITHMISQVTFPAYVKLQDDLFRLRESCLKSLYLTAVLSSFLTALIFVSIHDFSLYFLGEKWLQIVTITQILVIAGFIRSLAAILGPVFQAIGKPEIDTFSQIIRLSVFLTFIYPLSVKFGLVGIAYAVLLSIFFTCIFLYFRVVKIIGLKLVRTFKILSFPLSGVIIVTIFYVFRNLNFGNKAVIWDFLFLFFELLLLVCAFVLFDFRYAPFKITTLIKNLRNDNRRNL